MQRGEVWMVTLPASTGREQAGERPTIIVQDSAYGQGSPLVLIVPITSQLSALRFPATVRIDSTNENGLNLDSVAMVFQMRTLDRMRFRRKLGSLSQIDLIAVLTELNRLTGQ